MRINAVIVLATCTPLAAQIDHFTSSPRGYEVTEGEGAIDLIGRQSRLRFQQIDATNGRKWNINRLSFRRDGDAPDNLQFRSRTLSMAMVFSESDIETASRHFEDNYKTNTATVFDRKTVAFPDWSLAPVSPPASNSVVIYLDRLYSYSGKDVTGNDLLWEVVVWSNSRAGSSYPMDADPVVLRSSVDYGESIGPGGCIPSSGAANATIYTHVFNWLKAFEIDVNIFQGEPDSPAFALFGFSDGQLRHPALCSTLHVGGEQHLALPLGSTDGGGFIAAEFELGYESRLIGRDLYSQAVVLDPGQPFTIGVTLTDGNVTRFPANPPSASQAVHLWANDPTATRATSRRARRWRHRPHQPHLIRGQVPKQYSARTLRR